MRGEAAQISSTLATPRAVSRIAWTRSGRSRPGLGLELGEQAVDVVDVLGPLDLGDHDHVELVAGLGDQRGEVVETPRRVEAVDPGPQLGVAEVDRRVPTSTRPARAASLSAIGMASSRLPSRMSTVGTMSGSLATILSFCGGKKWITRLGRNGISRSGCGRADGERLEEVLGTAHAREAMCRCGRSRDGA